MNNNKTIEYQYLYFKKFSGQSWFIYKGIAQNGLITHFMAQTSENSPRVYGKSVAGNIVTKLADKIIVQWPEMVDVYGGKAEYLGTLV